jgi:26S proteasome non-ATPase regulatory subunit 9
VAGVENGHLKSFDKIGDASDVEMEESNDALDIDKGGLLNVPPFAKIDNVMDGSPAQEAGFKIDDLIVKFGTIDFTNNRNLRALGETVINSHSNGEGIMVHVSRVIDDEQKKVSLKLKPNEWNGKGLVGCTFSIHKM